MYGTTLMSTLPTRIQRKRNINTMSHITEAKQQLKCVRFCFPEHSERKNNKYDHFNILLVSPKTMESELKLMHAIFLSNEEVLRFGQIPKSIIRRF